MPSPGWLRCLFGFITLCLLYILLSGVGLHINPNSTAAERLENAAWVATSKSWIDRQMCNWFELCGTYHMIHVSGWTGWENVQDNIPPPRLPDFTEYWRSGDEDPETWDAEEVRSREIPQYVLDYAPYVHLFSREQYWPSDIAEHLTHISPYLNYSLIEEMEDDRELANLDELNDLDGGRHGRFVYLQSDDNVEEKPGWLTSKHNIPALPDSRKRIEFDAPWPGTGDDSEDDFDPVLLDQQQLEEEHEASWSPMPTFPTLPQDLKVSGNGRCGGNSGFTCEGSKFGQCCSIHGWCGKSDEFCSVDFCDPMHGKCTDPLYPPPGPKQELRRRRKRDSMDVRSDEETEAEATRDLPDVTAAQQKAATTSIGKSNAPAILVVADKGNGTVDAFWFFFYSFNLGQKVFNIRFGNHVGDWEHTCIRFRDGKPEEIFLSEHDFGDAYAWHAIEKYFPNPDGSGTMLGTRSNATIAKVAKRPVLYSAVGSHAVYGTPGVHPYVLPWGLLHDQTDRGPLWDPSLNFQGFVYNTSSQTAKSAMTNPLAPTGWFDYAGHWGDKYYPLSDPRQYRFAGQYHYVNGPTGPKFKRLGREDICQRRGVCKIKHWLGGERAVRVKPDDGKGLGDEEGGLPGGNSTEDAA